MKERSKGRENEQVGVDIASKINVEIRRDRCLW